MEPINHALQKWMDKNKDFKQTFQEMKYKTLNHPAIKDFLERHPSLTDAEIERSLNKLHEYTTQSIRCNHCQSYERCINNLQGYTPVLDVVRDEIHLTYEKCPNHLQVENKRKEQSLVQSLYVPKDILHARMKNLETSEERYPAIRKITYFLEQAENELPSRGLYFSGPFGVGKTYFLGVLANELKKINISSTIIYMPEFVQEMKSGIKDNTVHEKVNYFKETDVLMLDDIGAETMSAWFRDEILGSILQYRMMEQLPVFFTSNYSMTQLEEVLSTSTKGDIEKVKAGRIMERIKQVSEEVALEGENRRNESF